MNRMSRVYTSLSYFLILLAIVCTPVVGRSATTVATPTFSLAAGSYTGVQSATISDGTSGASCYYTLTAGTTGTTPTTSSTKYSSAISVTATSVLEALCAYSGDTNFAVASATRTYTYGLQRISQNLSPSVTGNNAWTPSFYVYDGAGSVRQLTNSAGVVTDEYEYDAYGNSFTKQGTTPNNYLYRGEQYDPDLGLYYLRARYYNPATGRFLSRDPLDGNAIDPASLHKYLYAGGDPVNAIDPTGRDFLGYIKRLAISVYEFEVYKSDLCYFGNMLAAIIAIEGGIRGVSGNTKEAVIDGLIAGIVIGVQRAFCSY